MSAKSFVSSYVVDDDILVVKLHGRLDTETTAEFEAEVNKHFEQGMRKMIIGCANLGYISSLGVGAWVRLQVRLRRQGGKRSWLRFKRSFPTYFGSLGWRKCSKSTETLNSPGNPSVNQRAGIVQRLTDLESNLTSAIERAQSLAHLANNRAKFQWMKEHIYGENTVINGVHGPAYTLRNSGQYAHRP